MKLIVATVAVGFARLALASLVAAQVVGAGHTEPVRPRIEVGPTGGTTGAFPELGAVFSVPVDRRLAVEVVVGRMPATWEAPPHTLAQVQLRTPFRGDLRSRKSLVVGVTRIVARRRAGVPRRQRRRHVRAPARRRQPAVAHRARLRSPRRLPRHHHVRRRAAPRPPRDGGLRVASGIVAMTARALGLACAFTLCARLALAPAATAQDGPPVTQAVPPRLEIGGSVGLIWVTPTIGLLASVPASRWVAVEGTVNLTTQYVLSQGQLRMPFGAPRNVRPSLVVGLTHWSPRGGTQGPVQTGLGAHGGASWQAPLGGAFDLRADVQLHLPFRDGPDADPRAAMTFVWHPRTGR